MSYDFTSLCIVRFISGFLAIALMFSLWSKRKAPGASSLIIFEIFAAIWAISDGFESAATTLPLKLAWAHISYIGITNSSVMFLIFSLSYTRNYRFLKKGFLISLFIIPFITILLAFTSSFHHLLWSRVIILPGTNQSVYYYGSWFWVNAIYQYSLLITGTIILIMTAFRTYSLYKAQIWSLIIGVMFPFCGSILYVFKLTPIRGIDFTPIAFIFSGILIAISLYWFGFFDIVPIAQQQTIDNLQDGLLVLDTGNRIVTSNPSFSRISGLNSDQMSGKSLDEVLSSLKLQASDIIGQNEFSAEIKLENKGDLKYYEVKVQPVKDTRQNLVGRLLTVHDITLKKMILDAVTESNKQRMNEIIEKEKLIKDLDAYARSVAHDLKNPVSTVIGFCDLIRTSLSENKLDEACEMLNMVENQGRKINKIIDDLLLLSRIRKEDIKIVPIETGNIINEAVARQKDLIISTNARIEEPDKWPIVYGQSQWVEQIWVNLISNAIKYGGKPPVIKIGFKKESESLVWFWINDNGNGLPPESLAKLFNDFERLEKTDIEGHGLGLSIVRRIVNKLGGETKAESTNKPGEGCTFSFTLKTGSA
ncbi:MAG: histidine kinase N-terminal 7TM domain-containing protein [Bacteroidales bacterium]